MNEGIALINLIVGTDGKIGGALLQRLKRSGKQVLGTTRRMEKVQKDNLYLNLAEDVSDWPVPDGVQAAVICAGVSSVGACASDPLGTAQVKVDGTLLRRTMATLSPSSPSCASVFAFCRPYSVIGENASSAR